MSRTSRRRKGAANAGSFRPGFDPRRHVFTASECRVGWWVANIKHPHLRPWLRKKLFAHYHQKGTAHGKATQAARPAG
jgi:hypothetical protein